MAGELTSIIRKLADRISLEADEAERAFRILMSGAASEAEIAGFLVALHMKGESITELVAAARVLRAMMLKVEAPPDAIDCCGTGGDAQGTYNISTAVSFVLAGAGIPVAKHGNRALSSRSGAADVLAALGVKLTSDPALIARSLAEAGIGFMMAPNHHAAMKHVGAVRAALGLRTVFNLLGPLINPAGVKRQLVGVFSESWLGPMAETLRGLGAERAWIVHGAGLDELTTTGISKVAELKDGRIRHFEVSAQSAGLGAARPQDLIGGSAKENAAALRALLDGARGAYRDIVLLNAAACFVVAEKAAQLEEGVALAAAAVDEGRAARALDRLVAITNAP